MTKNPLGGDRLSSSVNPKALEMNSPADDAASNGAGVEKLDVGV
jgi:hypothetical protein